MRFEQWIVVGLTVLYFLTYAGLSLLRHGTFHSFGPDLGIFDQIFWNTIHGRPWESTMSLGQPTPHSYLGDHFSPVYLLLLPFYAVVPHPGTLLVLQTLALALGVWPIYLLARDTFASAAVRFAWVGVYFLFLPLAFINLFDFHELAFAVLPLGFAIYFLERGQTPWFVLSLLAAFLIKEELPLTGIGFGVYILLGKREWRLGLGVLLGSALSFLAIIRLIIPAFGGGAGYVYFAARYGQLGNTPQQILLTVLTHPRTVLQTLLQGQKLKFLLGIFGPVLGLTALSGWAILLVLPTLAVLLLSNYPPQYAFSSHYSAPLIALVIGTSVLGLARLPARLHGPVTAAILLSSLGFSVLVGDLPFSRHFDPAMFRAEARYLAFAPVLDRVPSNASVASENNLTPHLTHRRFIYNLEFEGAQGASYVALDFAGVGRSRDLFARQRDELLTQGYRLVATGDGLALLQKP